MNCCGKYRNLDFCKIAAVLNLFSRFILFTRPPSKSIPAFQNMFSERIYSLLQLRIGQNIIAADILAQPFKEILARLVVQHPLIVVLETQRLQQSKVLNKIQ
jgi:hypothetical protein